MASAAVNETRNGGVFAGNAGPACCLISAGDNFNIIIMRVYAATTEANISIALLCWYPGKLSELAADRHYRPAP